LTLIKEKEDMEKEGKMAKFSQIFRKAFNSIYDYIKKFIPNENLRKRVLSSAVLVPIAIYAMFFSINLFFLIALSITIMMTVEWVDIIRSAKNQRKWRLIGFFYVLIPVFCVIKIRLIEPYILLWMFVIIWSTDIFAYFAGKAIGGPKLAPLISPNKTWSGLIGGVLACSLIGLISSLLFSGSALFFIIASFALSIIEQVSDLTESKIKRIFNLKDSGNIIPGHGGIIDRLDGMVLVAPAVLFLITLFPANFFS